MKEHNRLGLRIFHRPVTTTEHSVPEPTNEQQYFNLGKLKLHYPLLMTSLAAHSQAPAPSSLEDMVHVLLKGSRTRTQHLCFFNTLTAPISHHRSNAAGSLPVTLDICSMRSTPSLLHADRTLSIFSSPCSKRVSGRCGRYVGNTACSRTVIHVGCV